MGWNMPASMAANQTNQIPNAALGEQTLQDLLAGRSIGGLMPSPAMMGAVFNAVMNAYKNDPSLNLSQFNSAYTMPAINGGNPQAYAAAMSFLTQLSNQNKYLDPNLTAQLGPARGMNSAVMGARSEAITGLRNAFKDNSDWQNAAGNWTKAYGNLNAVPVDMWQEAMNPYLSLAGTMPEIANNYNNFVNVPTSSAGLPYQGQQFLQGLANATAFTNGGNVITGRGLVRAPELRLLDSINNAQDAGSNAYKGATVTATGAGPRLNQGVQGTVRVKDLAVNPGLLTSDQNAQMHFQNYLGIASSQFGKNPHGFKDYMLKPLNKQSMIKNLGADGTNLYRRLLSYIDRVIQSGNWDQLI